MLNGQRQKLTYSCAESQVSFQSGHAGVGAATTLRTQITLQHRFCTSQTKLCYEELNLWYKDAFWRDKLHLLLQELMASLIFYTLLYMQSCHYMQSSTAVTVSVVLVPTWLGHWTFLCSFTSFFHFLSTSWLKAGRPGRAYFSWGEQHEGDEVNERSASQHQH